MWKVLAAIGLKIHQDGYSYTASECSYLSFKKTIYSLGTGKMSVNQNQSQHQLFEP